MRAADVKALNRDFQTFSSERRGVFMVDDIGIPLEVQRTAMIAIPSFVPLRPERVVEVRYDHTDGERFCHTAQFNHWRRGRDPRSCTYA